VQRFTIDDLPREPWRNGAGWTRTVCSHEAGGRLWWRVSVADITAAGPFSRFDGMHRTTVMLRGARLCLSRAGHLLAFDGPGSALQFPGEWALQCGAPAQPTRLLNIMVRRGSARARVRVAEAEALNLPAGGAQVALVLRGRFDLLLQDGGQHPLEAGEGVHWPRQDAAWRAVPVTSNAAMVWCALHSIPGPSLHPARVDGE
jgi:hypothetical protein